MESDLFCIEVLGHKEDFRGVAELQCKIMYYFIRHRGLEEDFQEYVRRGFMMGRNISPEISNGIWKLRRNAELKNLFNKLKNEDADMVDDIINNIHRTMENWDDEKK